MQLRATWDFSVIAEKNGIKKLVYEKPKSEIQEAIEGYKLINSIQAANVIEKLNEVFNATHDLLTR